MWFWKWRKMIFAVCMVGCAILCGCGGDISNEIRVRSFNAFIPPPGVDASLSFTAGTTSLTGGTAVAFGQMSHGYATVSNQSFTPVATGPGTTSSIVFQVPFTLLGNSTAYTLAATGQAGQAGTFLPQLIATRNYTPDQLALPVGSVAIRVINLSLNPHPIGLYSTTNGVPTATIATAVASVAYGYDIAANAYTAVAADQLTKMALVDTTNTSAALTLSAGSNLNDIVLFAGQAYSLYIYGQPLNSAQPLGATWVLDYPAL
jgi:hypothetical protein